MLMGSTADPVENVKFIDTLLRLGVSYHFEDDIKNQLETIFTSHHNIFSENHHDLNSTLIVVHGEDILEEALVFSTGHLKLLAKKSSPYLAKQIANALDQPFNKCPPRLAARTYISFYEEDDSRNEALLNFAKLDFN
ncbi:hypothetical protein CXB51_000757 [Gossypium anomalum]|uniref:Terpene synthase N-terminal domain-containing protein n=1 Tax=Gossypium anomalum TaxID=47600 RepID=A0A8J6DBV8_9ROSI|nr:hypothetical protein CXB51_000757 [Gossypium anomalum]